MGSSGPDALAAADRIFTNDMLGLEVGQVRYAPFCDENGKMVGDGTVFKFTDSSAWVITALDSDLDHMREVVSGMNVSIEPLTEKLPHVQLPGPALPRGARGSRRRRRREPPRTSASSRTRCTSDASLSGSPVPATRGAGLRDLHGAGLRRGLWGVLTEAGARPYGLSAVETLRIESGLIFIGYDYFQHETDPSTCRSTR